MCSMHAAVFRISPLNMQAAFLRNSGNPWAIAFLVAMTASWCAPGIEKALKTGKMTFSHDINWTIATWLNYSTGLRKNFFSELLAHQFDESDMSAGSATWQSAWATVITQPRRFLL